MKKGFIQSGAVVAIGTLALAGAFLLATANNSNKSVHPQRNERGASEDPQISPPGRARSQFIQDFGPATIFPKNVRIEGDLFVLGQIQGQGNLNIADLIVVDRETSDVIIQGSPSTLRVNSNLFVRDNAGIGVNPDDLGIVGPQRGNLIVSNTISLGIASTTTPPRFFGQINADANGLNLVPQQTNATVNIGGNSLVVASLSLDPVLATSGQIYYNSSSNRLRVFEGGFWKDATGGVPKFATGQLSPSGGFQRVDLGFRPGLIIIHAVGRSFGCPDGLYRSYGTATSPGDQSSTVTIEVGRQPSTRAFSAPNIVHFAGFGPEIIARLSQMDDVSFTLEWLSINVPPGCSLGPAILQWSAFGI